MKHTTRIAKTIVLLTVVGALLLGTSSPASARTLDRQGWTGSYSVAPVTCRAKIHGQYHSLQIKAPAPRVQAANFRAGLGNDAQYVRYAAFLQDYRTGRTLAVTNYSGWIVATDNRVSTWTGATNWTVDASGGRIYKVVYLVEWWLGGMVGAVAHEANNVHYISHTNVKYTGMGACWRYA